MSFVKKLTLYLAFFVLLLAGFYYFLFRGTDNWKSKLPVISYVQPFRFVNQLGDTVTEAALTNHITVANYFFATCHGICPHMNGNVKKLYNTYKGNQDLFFLSHTCQPENDSEPVLKHYSDSIGADGKQWQFVTGNKLQLYGMARESYHIDDPKNNVGDINDQFLHSQFIALVDRKGQVRGIYDGLKDSEMQQLAIDIKDLIKESGKSHFVNGVFGNSPGM